MKTTTLRNGTEVIAKENGRPLHYANNTQAEKRARKEIEAGNNVEVIQPRFSVCFFLMIVRLTDSDLVNV